jgi:hypothetical protein
MTQNLFVVHLASAATLINIKNSRKHFEKLEGVKNTHSQSYAR